jgi:general stress protein 26
MNNGKRLAELHTLIEKIETAMFTTRRADGRLVSRPMATQTQARLRCGREELISGC